MRRTNKKGFTIVELVIVIAVIAILAAVLIPTFASLVDKAHLSADEQAVRQMNTALAVYTAEKGAPKNSSEVKYALSENGINADTMTPVTQGYAFYWDNTNNKIVLVGADKATAQSGWALLTSTGYGVKPTQAVTDVESLKSAINESSTKGTVLVQLDQDITVAEETGKESITDMRGVVFAVKNGQSLILDLNNHTISSSAQNCELFYVENGGYLEVRNATIEAIDREFYNNAGTLNLTNVTITRQQNTSNKGSVFSKGLADTSIVKSKITNSGGHGVSTNNEKPEYRGVRLSIIDSTIESTAECRSDGIREDYAGLNVTIYADVIIENSTIKGLGHGAYLRGCNATIKNSTFVSTYSGNEVTNTKWKDGNNGPYAGLVLACGGNSASRYSAYTQNVSIHCEGVTADQVIVNEPEGGKISLTGDLEIDHTCHKGYGVGCTGNDSTN